MMKGETVLTDEERKEVWGQFMRENREPFGDITKQELRQAFDETDEWLEANFAGYEASLPSKALSILSPTQRLKLLRDVIDKRLSKASQKE